MSKWDRLFDNITDMPYSADRTFVATLRVLVRHRLPAAQSLHFAYIPLASHPVVTRQQALGRLVDTLWLPYDTRKAFAPQWERNGEAARKTFRESGAAP